MPIVVHNQHCVFYETEGKRGPFLVLLHDWFGSHQDWYQYGFVEALSKQFRLLIIDCPGHGRCDAALDQQCGLPELAGAVLSVLDEVGAINAHFIGFSLGALVGMELLRYHPSRIRIAILGGDTPFVDDAMAKHLKQLSQSIEITQPPPQESQDNKQLPSAKLKHLNLNSTENQQLGISKLIAQCASIQNMPEVPFNPQSPVTFLVPLADEPAMERLHQARRMMERVRWVGFEAVTGSNLLSNTTLLLKTFHHILLGHRQAT